MKVQIEFRRIDKMKVKIEIEQETLERLRPLGSVEETPDTIINRIIDYIGFHSKEFKNSNS
jgi:hypothetical protein